MSAPFPPQTVTAITASNFNRVSISQSTPAQNSRLKTHSFFGLHCQQKRQQRCWKSAELGSDRVGLTHRQNGHFSLETTLKATVSDSRLQTPPLHLLRTV